MSYSYRNICDGCFKEKKCNTKYIGFFFYCTVCLSVTSFSHTSEEGKNLLEYDSKEESQTLHFFICLGENQVKNNYNKIHLSAHSKSCYT